MLSEVYSDPGAPIVHYTAIEPYPVEIELVLALNYGDLVPGFDEERRNKYFRALHTAEGNGPTELWPGFVLEKRKSSIENYEPIFLYDLIFFDAFAPRVQPEMWTKEVFDKMYAALNPGGILVTYCAKGEVRRNMEAAGFSVERIPGPPGKREMLRAVKLGVTRT